MSWSYTQIQIQPSPIQLSSAQLHSILHANTLMGASNDPSTVLLTEHGNDLVRTGAENNTIKAGGGIDQLVASGEGARNLLVGTTGAHQTLSASTGEFDLLMGHSGSGSDLTLTATGGHDVLFPGAGDHDSVDASGNTIFAGDYGANHDATLVASGGYNAFQIGSVGVDTMLGGGSSNTIDFVSHALDSNAAISTASRGVTTVHFSDDGQPFTVSDVQTLHFHGGGV